MQLKFLFQTLKEWVSGRLVKRLLKNVGTLVTGSLGSSAFALVSLAITARALGANDFGRLVLIVSYVQLVDAVCNFQSWRTLIKYGADVLENQQPTALKDLIKFCFLLDVGTAILGATVAFFGVSIARDIFDWTSQDALMAMMYSLAIIFKLTGVPRGVLRLFDAFRALAIIQVAAAILKLAFVLLAWLAGGTIWTFFLAWLSAELVGALMLLTVSIWELRKQEIRGLARASAKRVPKQHQGVWEFCWSTYWYSSVNGVAAHFDKVLLGWLLPPSAVGVYKVVKKIAQVLDKITNPLHQVIYPDLAKLWSQRDRKGFRRLVIRPAVLFVLVAVAFWTLFLLAGPLLLHLTVSNDFSDAYGPSLVYLIGAVFGVATFALQPALLAMGLANTALKLKVISFLLYFPALVLLTQAYGLYGTAAAFVFYNLVWGILMSYVVFPGIRKMEFP